MEAAIDTLALRVGIDTAEDRGTCPPNCGSRSIPTAPHGSGRWPDEIVVKGAPDTVLPLLR